MDWLIGGLHVAVRGAACGCLQHVAGPILEKGGLL